MDSPNNLFLYKLKLQIKREVISYHRSSKKIKYLKILRGHYVLAAAAPRRSLILRDEISWIALKGPADGTSDFRVASWFISASESAFLSSFSSVCNMNADKNYFRRFRANLTAFCFPFSCISSIASFDVRCTTEVDLNLMFPFV